MVSTLLILAPQVKLHDNEQLLNEAEYDVKNYADQGECYPPRLKAENNIILHIRHTKVEYNNCKFLFIQNISEFLKKANLLQTFFKTDVRI